MQEAPKTAAAATPAPDQRRRPARALAAAAAVAGLAAAGAATCAPILAGMSLNHNETLVSGDRRPRPGSADDPTRN